MTFTYRLDRLEPFQTMAMPGEWKEQAPSAWINSVGLTELSPKVANQKITRAYMKAASQDRSVSDRDLLWAILAWGQMNRVAARRLAANERLWCTITGRLRNEGLSRSESYTVCSEAVQSVRAGGIGPAYFTKLIFFANPRHDGYIMDQWTSRSVNFLIDGPPVIRMRTKDHVDPRNDAEVFEQYCCIVEDLSQQLTSKTPEETEQCLFSSGGKSPSPWRRFLKENGG